MNMKVLTAVEGVEVIGSTAKYYDGVNHTEVAACIDGNWIINPSGQALVDQNSAKRGRSKSSGAKEATDNAADNAADSGGESQDGKG